MKVPHPHKGLIDAKELRKAAGQIADSGHAGWGNAMSDAADTIEAQAAEIERLRVAVQAFIDYDTTDESDGVVMMLNYNEALRLCHAAIAKEKTS